MPTANLEEIRSKIGELSYHALNLAQSQVERDRNNARATRDYDRIQACKDLMRDIDKLRHSPVRMTDVKLAPQQQRPTPPAKPATVAKPTTPAKAARPIPAPRVLQQVRAGVQGEPLNAAEPGQAESTGDGAEQLAAPTAPAFRTVKILNAHTVPQLREMCGAGKLAMGGNKAELVARLIDEQP